MSAIDVIKIPEKTVVVPASYEVTLKLDQEQLDWLVDFCGSISGTYTTPLRRVTDKIYEELKVYRKEKINTVKTHWVGDISEVEYV